MYRYPPSSKHKIYNTFQSETPMFPIKTYRKPRYRSQSKNPSANHFSSNAYFSFWKTSSLSVTLPSSSQQARSFFYGFINFLPFRFTITGVPPRKRYRTTSHPARSCTGILIRICFRSSCEMVPTERNDGSLRFSPSKKSSERRSRICSVSTAGFSRAISEENDRIRKNASV